MNFSQDASDNKIESFLRAAAITEKRAKSFDWRKSIAIRYFTISDFAREILVLQTSPVSSKEMFSNVCKLV